MPTQAADRVDIVDEEICILEPAQHRDIDENPDGKEDLRLAFTFGSDGSLDPIADDVVEGDRKQQQRQVFKSPPGIEDQRENGQNQLRERLLSSKSVSRDKRNREEAKYKWK